MTELSVGKKSIDKLFRELEKNKFIIPEYQRPYSWDVENCETLWNDIRDFFENNRDNENGQDNENEYFLGTIVSCKSGKDIEIIDGQQRITSFMLLLRAFYKKLESMSIEDVAVQGLKSQIAPCIWEVDSLSQQVEDNKKIKLLSKVVTDEDNVVFHSIVETGVAENLKDNYTLNYKYFQEQCGMYASAQPLHWKQLCLTILKRCIVMPIECHSAETALRIFSTLNDRGMPLNDSDIFKAELYKNCPEDKRRDFTEDWKQLTKLCDEARISLNDVFRYYTHTIRARSGERSKEIGLRTFYMSSKGRLQDESLLSDIMLLAKFWLYINSGTRDQEHIKFELSLRTRMYLQCLELYPNEFWKYITSVFFLIHRDTANFDNIFSKFLEKVIRYLFVKFIEKPSVNAIKDGIYSGYIAIYNNDEHYLQHSANIETIKTNIDNHTNSKLTRALLLLDAYMNDNQKELIKHTFHIEHILPKKWQDTNYQGWNRDDADKHLECFGNKVVLERKLNIRAGNGYFGQKKQRFYKDSEISLVKDLCNHEANDWSKSDIEQRDKEFKIRIFNFLGVNANEE